MKTHPFFKTALFSFLGLVIVLNCNAQTHKEKKSEKNEKRKTEQRNNFDSMNSLVHSRNFVFRSGPSESQQVYSLTEKQEYHKSVISINGSLVRISGLNSAQWWKQTSGTIDTWEITENPEDLTCSVSFIARTPETNTSILITIFSDKTAIAQFAGDQFRGKVSPN